MCLDQCPEKEYQFQYSVSLVASEMFSCLRLEMFPFCPYLWLCVSLSDEEELGGPSFLASIRERVILSLPWLHRCLVGGVEETRADRDLNPPDSGALSIHGCALSAGYMERRRRTWAFKAAISPSRCQRGSLNSRQCWAL